VTHLKLKREKTSFLRIVLLHTRQPYIIYIFKHVSENAKVHQFGHM